VSVHSPKPRPRNESIARRVLVVDDDPSIRRVIARVLRWHEYEADAVGTMDEALARLDQVIYAAATIDHDLGPGPTGVHLARAMVSRQGRRAPPRILLSSTPEVACAPSLFQARLRKPFRALELLEALAEVQPDAPRSGVRRRG
jgi:CheY-like chemotaxis protein